MSNNHQTEKNTVPEQNEPVMHDRAPDMFA